ncbi:MAG: LysM peptidoglycan-binding domain-containing protein, partial [Deltaproteobacteria bacterium]|nr:LysM peptidoglycan-binding domain-containing protein [Deltaproteobacteria bacterium]
MGQGEEVTLEVTETLETENLSAPANGELVLTDKGEIEEFSVDKIYVIQPGDTLWDICSLLLDDPYYWPKLWSLNQYIKNPHLIFPGDQLVFTSGTESAFPNLEIIQEDEEETMFEVVRGEKKPTKEDEIYKPIADPFGTTVVEKNVDTGTGVS